MWWRKDEKFSLDEALGRFEDALPQERAEVIAAYIRRFGDDWKSRIVSDLQSISSLSRRSLQRRFQTGRHLSPRVSPRQRSEYRQLGAQLGPMLPGEIRVSGPVWFKISEQWIRRRINFSFEFPRMEFIFRENFKDIAWTLAEEYWGPEDISMVEDVELDPQEIVIEVVQP